MRAPAPGVGYWAPTSSYRAGPWRTASSTLMMPLRSTAGPFAKPGPASANLRHGGGVRRRRRRPAAERGRGRTRGLGEARMATCGTLKQGG